MLIFLVTPSLVVLPSVALFERVCWGVDISALGPISNASPWCLCTGLIVVFLVSKC